MNVIDTFKALFNSQKANSAAATLRDAFSAASDSYSAAYDAIQSHTTRANHRSAILNARRAYDGDAYKKEVAAYTDPADFAPYTEAELEAHTAVMKKLAAAFDTFTAAFSAFKPVDCHLASTAADLYRAYCDTYAFAAQAYRNAASCAMVTALEGNLQAVKDEWKTSLLENRAANATAADAGTAKEKAAAFKAKAAEDASKAKQLELKARTAETEAEAFLSKSESAAAIAGQALERKEGS